MCIKVESINRSTNKKIGKADFLLVVCVAVWQERGTGSYIYNPLLCEYEKERGDAANGRRAFYL